MKYKKFGSSHYKTGNIEPIDLINAGEMLRDFALGNIIKYAFRNRRKYRNVIKLEDLEKIKHYCDILIEHEVESRKKHKQIIKIKEPKDVEKMVPKKETVVEV